MDCSWKHEALFVGLCAASFLVNLLFLCQNVIKVPLPFASEGHVQQYLEFRNTLVVGNLSTSPQSKEHVFLEDDDNIAKELFNSVRVLCWIMTCPKYLEHKARHVRATWGKRCNKLLFASDYLSSEFPTINITVQKGAHHLTEKTMKTFMYIFEHHMNDADWFLKADDDTYVIMENLRYFLSNKDPNKPVLFGNHFDFGRHSFMSGGAGYVVSKEAMQRYGINGSKICAHDGTREDVDWARCMTSLGVIHGEARDKYNRTLFHCQIPNNVIQGTGPQWIGLQTYGADKGIDHISDFAISFHYIQPFDMYLLEFYVYHLKPYGILSGLKQVHKETFESLKGTV